MSLYVSVLPSCMRVPHVVTGACLGQKKVTDPLEPDSGSQPSCGCWEPTLGPLQEEQVLVTAESSLQPSSCLEVGEITLPEILG